MRTLFLSLLLFGSATTDLQAQTPLPPTQVLPNKSILGNELLTYALNSAASPGTLLDNTVRDLLDEELAGVNLLPTKATFSYRPAFDFGIDIVLSCPDETCYLTASNYGDNRDQLPYATTLFYAVPRAGDFDAKRLDLLGAALANPDSSWSTQEFLLARSKNQTTRWPTGVVRYRFLDAADRPLAEAVLTPENSGTVVSIDRLPVTKSARVHKLRVEFDSF